MPISIDTSKRPPGYEDADRDQISDKAKYAMNGANDRKAYPVLLHGGVGCGKTSAAAVQYGYHYSPLWFRADDLLLSMSFGRKDGVRCEAGRFFRGYKQLKWAEFRREMDSDRNYVILDDLGLRPPTDTMYQSLFDVLEWRKGKPLLITSNKSPEDLALLYDDRIKSRLRAGTVVNMDGPDRRAAKGFRIDARQAVTK